MPGCELPGGRPGPESEEEAGLGSSRAGVGGAAFPADTSALCIQDPADGQLTPAISTSEAGHYKCVPWMSLLTLGRLGFWEPRDCSVMGLSKLPQVGRFGGSLVEDFSTKMIITCQTFTRRH